MWMFIAALFIIIYIKKKKNGNQPRDAVAEWINKGWWIHIVECHFVIKKKWVIKLSKDMEKTEVHIAK